LEQFLAQIQPLGFYSLGLSQYNAGQFTAANPSLANAVNTQPHYRKAQAHLKKLKKQLVPKKARRSRKSAQAHLFAADVPA